MESFRNPLSVAFGSFLRRERKNREFSAEKMAEKIGITKSFYTLVENGTNYFHVKNGPSIVIALDKAICLHRVTGLLMAISHMESFARDFRSGYKIGLKKRYIDGLKSSMDVLSSLDAKGIGVLVDQFRNDSLLESVVDANARQAAKIIAEYGIEEDISEFLIVGNNAEVRKTTGSIVSEKMNQIPSMYFEFMSDLIDRLVSLPMQIGFHEMWRWEDDQRRNFREWLCVHGDSSSVVSQVNLERYHYNYLWEPGFKRARIIFLDGQDAQRLKAEFVSIMRGRLHASVNGECAPEHVVENAKEKLANFEWAMEKIEFKSLKNIEQDADLSMLINRVLPENYSSVWIFTMKSGNEIGFQTKISGKHDKQQNLLIEGVSLNHFETDSRLHIMKRLWKGGGDLDGFGIEH